MVRRLCFYAGYSNRGILENYVIYCLKELSDYADIFYCADCDMADDELEKIKPFVKYCIAQRHHRYDFGSWQLLFSMVPNIDKYDELILMNDSVYGPLISLQPIFEKMQNADVSAWALCGNKFMMSFFIVLKKDIFTANWFADFMGNIKQLEDKADIVRLYEQGLSDLITQKGLKWDCVYSSNNLKKQINNAKKDIRSAFKLIPWSIRFCHHFRFNKIRVYDDDDFFMLFPLGMPFLKRFAFKLDINNFHILAPLFIKKYSAYDYELIDQDLSDNGVVPNHITYFEKIKRKIRAFLFEVKYKEYGMVYKICKIKVYVKKHKF